MWKGNFKNKNVEDGTCLDLFALNVSSDFLFTSLLNVGQAMPDNLNYSNERLFISYLSSKLHQSKL